MTRGSGKRPRARDIWRWCSLLPYIGAVPTCVVMVKRKHRRWACAAGAVTALWIVLTAVAGGSHTRGAAAALGGAILGLYVAQIVFSFCAPAGNLAGDRKPRRARWLWLSVIPLLGSWLPALAGLRARVWWWVLLGLACEGVGIDAVVQLAQSNQRSPA